MIEGAPISSHCIRCQTLGPDSSTISKLDLAEIPHRRVDMGEYAQVGSGGTQMNHIPRFESSYQEIRVNVSARCSQI